MSLNRSSRRSEPIHLQRFPSPLATPSDIDSPSDLMDSGSAPLAASTSTIAGAAAAATRGSAHAPPPPSTVPSVPSTSAPSVLPTPRLVSEPEGSRRAQGIPFAGGSPYAQLYPPPSLSSPNTNATASARPSAVAAAAPPHATTAGPNAHANALAVIPIDTARQVYNDKLRGSIDAIMEALAVELPHDHILLQLFADGTTEPYCKVRLGEVVESFLYASQADQFHALAAALAEKTGEALAMQQRIDELERLRAAARDREKGDSREGTHTVHRSHSGMDHYGEGVGGVHTPPHTSTQVSGIAAGTPGNASSTSDTHSTHNPNRSSDNPMAEEAARRALIAILEATSQEQELDRCRRALAAPARLGDIAHAEPRYAETLDYVSEVIVELFAVVHAFLHYADGSLESLEALRRDLSLTDSSSSRGGGTSRASGGLLAGAAIMNSATAALTSSTSGTSTPDATHRSPAAVERARIHKLGVSLRDAQILVARALERLRDSTNEQKRELNRLAREQAKLVESNAGAAVAAAAEVDSLRRRMEAMARDQERTLEDLRGEQERERVVNARRQRTEQQHQQRQQADIQQRLVTTEVELAAVREELRIAQQQRAEAAAEASSEAATLSRTLQRTRNELRAREYELLSARAQRILAELETQVHASQTAKHALLSESRDNEMRSAARKLADVTRCRQEELRHLRAQLQMREADSELRDVAERARVEELSGLLRGMWEDDSIASALQLVAEGARSDAFAGGAAKSTVHDSSGKDSSNPANPGLEQTFDTHTREHTNLDHPGDWRAVRDAHRLPTTLRGLTLALLAAHHTQRNRTEECRDTLHRARARLIEKDDRIRVLEASEARLRALLQAEQEQCASLRAELMRLGDANPMRELLARQDNLLRQVSDERNALQRQWGALTADYITLEKRNGQLHERCALKEHENAKLIGFMRQSGSTSGSGMAIGHSPASDFQTPTQRVMNPGSHGGGSSSSGKGSSAGPAAPAMRPAAARSFDSPESEAVGATAAADDGGSGWLMDSIGVTPVGKETDGIGSSVGGGASGDDLSIPRAPLAARTPVTIERRSGALSEGYDDDFESP